MALQLIQKFMTLNDCYKANRQIKVKGLMVHSTATPGVMAAGWFSRWNKPGLNPAKCVHAFLDAVECYQYLPWNWRSWHGGGMSNDTHIGVEWCEPSNLSDKAYFAKIWDNGVELYAMLCKMYGLNEAHIVSHKEGYRLGIASNHGDPDHWWGLHGKTMNHFRSDVAKALKGAYKKEEDDVLEKAIVINGLADLPAAEPLSLRLKCPFYFRTGLPSGKIAKEVFVIGGGSAGLNADKFTVLSGADRFATYAAVKKFLG